MPNLHVITGAGESPAYPIVRKIGFADLKYAVAKGIDDFSAVPTQVIFLAIIYPVVGLFLARMTFGYDVMPLLFPLASGFALIGPFAAIGLYELSRQRERGAEVSWKHVFGLLRHPSLDAIAALGMVLMVVFLIWLATAQSLYQSLFGYGSPESIGQFLSDILTTSAGWTLIIAGNGIGFLFAAFVLTISVVSFPLLLDREVGAMVAMHTSVRAVLRNPLMMAAWGLFVAVALVIGSLPFFVGLAVVLPVLAHSTWHLYRKVVEPDLSPRPEYRPRPPKPSRYAADFPAALFPWAGVRAVESATMVHAQCHTADEKMSVTFDAAPWFSETDAERIIHLAQQGWSSPSIADALQHRPGYERLRELMQYVTERLQEESLEDPAWSSFECIVSGPDALAWLAAHRPDVAAKIHEATGFKGEGIPTALILVLVALGSVLFHILSPWWWTSIASNWRYIDDTIIITFWITGAVFTAIVLFMAYCVFHFRHQPGRRAVYDPENKKLEWWLTIVTAVGVGAMLTPGLFVWNQFVTVPPGASEIEVIGQQWQWNFRLPGKDGRLGTSDTRYVSSDNPLGLNPNDRDAQDDVVIEADDLHLLVDKPVKVLLRSIDVVHSFYVPEFRTKMDMVPGMVSYVWFIPTRTGTFEILCAELCGAAHYNMRGKVVVEEESEYQAWLRKQKTFAQLSARARQAKGTR